MVLVSRLALLATPRVWAPLSWCTRRQPFDSKRSAASDVLADSSPRVVIDTNLVVSGAISRGSLPDQVLSAWEAEAFVWILSQALFSRLRTISSWAISGS